MKCISFVLLLLIPLTLCARKKDGQQLMDSLLIALPLQKDDSGKVNLLNSLAHEYLGTDPEKSEKYAEDALALSTRLGYKKGIAFAYYTLGNVCSMHGNSPEALKNETEALKIFESLGHKDGMGNCTFSIGTVYLNRDNYPEALKHYFAAIKLYEAAQDSSGIASCYLDIGNVYNVMVNYPEAFTNYSTALKIAQGIGDKDVQVFCLDNIANVYDLEGNTGEALKYEFAALKTAKEINKKSSIATCSKDLGNIYTAAKNYTEALKSFSIAEQMLRELGMNLPLSDVYGGMGVIYFEQKNFRKSEEYFNKALQLGEKINSLSIIKDAENLLSETYEQAGDYKRSMAAYKAYIVIRDSISNEENTRKVLEAKLQYEFDRKENQAKIAAAKNAAAQQLKLQQKDVFIYGALAAFASLLVIGLLLLRQNKLKASNRMIELEQKQLRAQMNPHFIFNCLNSIQHFVMANDVKNVNKYLSGFALLMRQTLENSTDSTVTLRKEIAYLKNYLSIEMMLFEEKFTYEINCAENIDVDSAELPSMIIQPFIENAIRHGLSYLTGKRGKLRIGFCLQQGYLVCEIDDNGIGREQSQKLKMGSGLAYESQGMDLTRQRLALVSKSYGSEYSILVTDKKDENNEAAGTTITIKFPLDK